MNGMIEIHDFTERYLEDAARNRIAVMGGSHSRNARLKCAHESTGIWSVIIISPVLRFR